MKPSLKAILEGYRGDIEVIAQALKAEVADLFHVASVRESGEIVRVRLLLTLMKGENACTETLVYIF